MLANGGAILNAVLFDVRQPLSTLKGAMQLLADHQDSVSSSTLAWLRKWEPDIATWASEQDRLRAYCLNPQETDPDWEKLIAEMGDALKDVTIMYEEAQASERPDGREANNLIDIAIKAIGHLSEMHRLIQSQEYKRLWASHHQNR